MEDKKKAMYEQGEHACALAVIFLEATVRDIEIAAHDGYDHDDFMDVVSSLQAMQEDLDGFISKIQEAGYYLDEACYPTQPLHFMRFVLCKPLFNSDC